MINLNPELLRQRKELIILEQAVAYCKSNGVDSLNNNRLKNECNARVEALGLGEKYGGIFDRHLDKWSSPEVPKEQRLLTVIRTKRPNGKTASCVIYPNIPKIESYLSGEKITQSLKEEFIQTDIDSELWLNVSRALQSERVHKMPATTWKDHFAKRNDDSYFKGLVAEFLAKAAVDEWNLAFSHPPDRKMKFSEPALQAMFHSARVIAKDNKFKFTLILEYSGPPNDYLLNSQYNSDKSKDTRMRSFVVWARRFNDTIITDEEKSQLAGGNCPYRLHSLYIEFLDTWSLYLNALNKAPSLTMDFKFH